MFLRRSSLFFGVFVLLGFLGFCEVSLAADMEAHEQPRATAARILLLPRRIVSGERATLAVLDANGRLAPGVMVRFSNGDEFTTDVTGRALFVAPLNLGVLFGSIVGRPGRVSTAVLDAAETEGAAMEVATAPRVASLSDRFEIAGHGFCGDADANTVRIGGQSAVVLASSPTSLVVLPPSELGPGDAGVEIACANRVAKAFSVSFVGLELEADRSPLKPGERRVLTVHVRGTTAHIPLEARNLAPEVAELAGGNPVRELSSGGANNVAHFDLRGRDRGSFMISIRLMPSAFHPEP
jgi:hypothetical protein